jgi:hypothetical protein
MFNADAFCLNDEALNLSDKALNLNLLKLHITYPTVIGDPIALYV